MPVKVLYPPFEGGVWFDSRHMPKPGNYLVEAKDLIMPDRTPQARGKWYTAYNDSTTAEAWNGIGVDYFPLVDMTYLVHSRDLSTNLYMNVVDLGDLAGAGSQVAATEFTADIVIASFHNKDYQRRAMYNGHQIWCGDDGETPCVLYSGGDFDTDDNFSLTSQTFNANDSRVEVTSGSYANADIAWYWSGVVAATSGRSPLHHYRVLDTTTTHADLENIYADNTITTHSTGGMKAYGYMYPCVNIYNQGLLTISSNTVTGTGVLWDGGGGWGEVNASWDSIMVLSGSDWIHTAISSVTNDTTLVTLGMANITTATNYQIMRPPCWTDVEVHKQSIWGIGQAEHPNRLYYGQKGWDLLLPPGLARPHDPTTTYQSPDPFDFELQYVDIPGPYDGSPIVGLLSVEDVLLVLKPDRVYGVFGDAEGLDFDIISHQAGCSHRNSIISTDWGVYWAGVDGIYTYSNGQIIDLTDKGFNITWRNVAGIAQNISMAAHEGHLIVTVKTASTTYRTFVHDLINGIWCGEFNNWPATSYGTYQEDGGEYRCWFTPYVGTSGSKISLSDASEVFFNHEYDADQENPEIHHTYGADAATLVGTPTSGSSFPDPTFTTSAGFLFENESDAFQEYTIEDIELLMQYQYANATQHVTLTVQGAEPLNYYDSATAADPHSIQVTGDAHPYSTLVSDSQTFASYDNTGGDNYGMINPIRYHWREIGLKCRFPQLSFQVDAASVFRLQGVRVRYSNGTDFS